MNIPTWMLEITTAGFGAVAFFGFRYILQLIKENKAEDDKARCEMKAEIKELKTSFYNRVEDSEGKLLKAIKEMSSDVVQKGHCDGRQEIWTERFENLLKTIETASNNRSEKDKLAHDSLGRSLDTLAAEMGEIKECVNKLAKNKEC